MKEVLETKLNIFRLLKRSELIRVKIFWQFFTFFWKGVEVIYWKRKGIVLLRSTIR